MPAKIKYEKKRWFDSIIAQLESKGLKKTDIAKKLDITPQRLTNLLNGNNVIYDKLIDDIRDTLTPGAYGRVREFLLEIPNRYVHFGDLDLGGVCIYLNEFRKVLGNRASMLVPDGYEELLRHGDKKLYQHELRPDVSLDERVAPLVDMIIRCKTGVEQEKLAWRAL